MINRMYPELDLLQAALWRGDLGGAKSAFRALAGIRERALTSGTTEGQNVLSRLVELHETLIHNEELQAHGSKFFVGQRVHFGKVQLLQVVQYTGVIVEVQPGMGQGFVYVVELPTGHRFELRANELSRAA